MKSNKMNKLYKNIKRKMKKAKRKSNFVIEMAQDMMDFVMNAKMIKKMKK